MACRSHMHACARDEIAPRSLSLARRSRRLSCVFTTALVLAMLGSAATAGAAALVPPLPSGDLDAAVDRSGEFSRKMQGRQGKYIGRHPAVIPLVRSWTRCLFGRLLYAASRITRVSRPRISLMRRSGSPTWTSALHSRSLMLSLLVPNMPSMDTPTARRSSRRASSRGS